MNRVRKTIASRAADALDLLIDFATLGEYGLEPSPAARPAGPSRLGGTSLGEQPTSSLRAGLPARGRRAA
jgi:hypothetical protein